MTLPLCDSDTAMVWYVPRDSDTIYIHMPTRTYGMEHDNRYMH